MSLSRHVSLSSLELIPLTLNSTAASRRTLAEVGDVDAGGVALPCTREREVLGEENEAEMIRCSLPFSAHQDLQRVFVQNALYFL